MNAKPISESSKSTWQQTGCVVIFGLIFFCAGVGMLVGMQVMPWLSSRASTNWQETPCTIVSSKVQTHKGEDSSSYSVEAEYTYEFNTQGFSSDQYDFNSVKRARKKCKEIVRLLPAGTKTICFVNPSDPQNAVLNREFLVSWLSLILGLIFSAVGAGIAIGLPLSMGRRKELKGTVGSQAGAAHSLHSGEGDSSGVYPEDVEDQKWDVPQRLKPASTKIGLLAVTIGAALFWNGILSVILWSVIRRLGGDFLSIFLLLFLIPFVLIGLVLIAGVVRSFLSLFNPVFEIAMNTGAIGRGNSADVAWEIKGNAKSIGRLRIVAVGTESAQYRQGTDTVTATSHFGLIPIVDTTDTEQISFGSQLLTIPADAMHTFVDEKNRVTWAIQVRADIRRWPDVFQQHDFRVKP